MSEMKPGPIRQVTGTELSNMLIPAPTTLEHMRDLAVEISQQALRGRELVDRRMEVLPEYATFHEDYRPLFDTIIGLAINLSAILKRENTDFDAIAKMAVSELPSILKSMEFRGPDRVFTPDAPPADRAGG